MKPKHGAMIGAALALVVCVVVLGALFFVNPVTVDPNSAPFWSGLTNPSATLQYSEYVERRSRLDGMRYQDVVELFGPGQFAGPTYSADGIIFNWSDPQQNPGGLTIICNPEGRIVDHYWSEE
jgi:hypothetical protein